MNCGAQLESGLRIGSVKDYRNKALSTETDYCDSEDPYIGTVIVTPTRSWRSEVAFEVVAGYMVPVEDCMGDRSRWAGQNTEEGCIWAARSLHYLHHETIDVPILLDLDCRNVVCSDANTTCVGSRCVPIDCPEGESCTAADLLTAAGGAGPRPSGGGAGPTDATGGTGEGRTGESGSGLGDTEAGGSSGNDPMGRDQNPAAAGAEIGGSAGMPGSGGSSGGAETGGVAGMPGGGGLGEAGGIAGGLAAGSPSANGGSDLAPAAGRGGAGTDDTGGNGTAAGSGAESSGAAGGSGTDGPGGAGGALPSVAEEGRSCTSGPPLTCGTDSCCLAPLVSEGTFGMGRGTEDDYTAGPVGSDEVPEQPATVLPFYLDKYEVTVARFRRFVAAIEGSPAYRPEPGAGAHPLDASSGWQQGYPELPALASATKACLHTTQTWTDTPDQNENLPISCVSWHLAFAFCVWDGGRLPMEVEWEYAAAGGAWELTFPDASSGRTAPTPTQALFGNNHDGVPWAVGTGTWRGVWGHADLAGNLVEWTRDNYDPVAYTGVPCEGAACFVIGTGNATHRGGSVSSPVEDLRAANRGQNDPLTYMGAHGIRCARDR